MVSRAARWVSGLTPAQQAASTEMGTSGNAAFSSSALLTTQISVQRPMSSRENGSSPTAPAMRDGNSMLLKVGFSTAV